MVIAIRHGRRFRIRSCYEGRRYRITRYEGEHNPDEWFYAVDAEIENLTLELDGVDGIALKHDLEQVRRGVLPETEFEAKLNDIIAETLRDDGGSGSHDEAKSNL